MFLLPSRGRKTLRRETLLSLIVALLAALPPAPGDAISLLREGDSLYQRGEYSRSLEQYRAAEGTRMLGIVPSVRAARARITRGKLATAEKGLRDLERVGADRGNTLAAHGILAYVQRSYSEARSLLDSALRLRPLDEEARYYLARSHLMLDDYDLAADELGLLLASPIPGESRWREAAHYNLGLIYLMGLTGSGRPRSSTLHGYSMHSRLGERNAEEHLREAELARADRGLRQKASRLISAIRSLREIGAQGADDIILMGSALLAVGETRLAREQLERAVDLQPERPDANAYLGYLSWLEGEHSRAEVLLERSVRSRADSPLGHYFLGVLRRSQQRLGEAVAEFERAIALDSESAPAHVELGRTLILERNYARAAEAIERSTELDPDNIDYHLLLTRFYLDHGIRLDRALAAAKRAAELSPNSPEVMDVLGWALWANGQTYDARHSLELAIAADPDLASAHYHLAVILQGIGDTRSAARELRLALELEPDGDYAARAEATLSDLRLR